MAEIAMPEAALTIEGYYAERKAAPLEGASQKERTLALHKAGALGTVVVYSEWAEQAACRPAEVSSEGFFPSTGVKDKRREELCKKCPVKDPCLDYALDQRIDKGWYGGKSERERRRILKARAAASATLDT